MCYLSLGSRWARISRKLSQEIIVTFQILIVRKCLGSLESTTWSGSSSTIDSTIIFTLPRATVVVVVVVFCPRLPHIGKVILIIVSLFSVIDGGDPAGGSTVEVS